MELIITRGAHADPAGFRIPIEDIPDYARRIAACAACDAIERFLRQPGARELLDAETQRRKENHHDHSRN